MSESIAEELYKKYKVTIGQKGFRHEGVDIQNTYGFSITVFGNILNSNKTYKRYGGAVIAAKRLIKKLEYGV